MIYRSLAWATWRLSLYALVRFSVARRRRRAAEEAEPAAVRAEVVDERRIVPAIVAAIERQRRSTPDADEYSIGYERAIENCLSAARRAGSAPPGPEPTQPHCDSSILHAPGSCDHCDKHPDWQAYRQLARIGFTGEEIGGDVAPCPSERFRPSERRDAWPGNRP